MTDDGGLLLSDGNRIPRLALGVWQVPDGQSCVDAVLWALEAGYRHIDTAQGYYNEASVGRALQQCGLPREDVFITTKFLPSNRDPALALEASLERLDLEYVDLYLVHWPEGGPTWAWQGMERAHGEGHARSIGVSNFNVAELNSVVGQASVVPVVDQVQMSPFSYRRGLLAEGERLGVHFEAYSPLGTGRLLSHHRVSDIAGRIGKTPAQVLLRWCIQHDLVVITKSTHRERIVENSHIFDFELSADELAELDGLDATGGTAEAQEFKWW
jgi:diketogulonate reductase-like aldo/keto reductase